MKKFLFLIKLYNILNKVVRLKLFNFKELIFKNQEKK